MLYFITGNAGKFHELKLVVPQLEQLELDLNEIQSLDPQAVIEHKLSEATAHHNGAFIVEDTSLACDGLNGLPGTFTKWFEKALGLGGLAEMAIRSGDPRCTARTMIGYRNAQGDTHYFEGTTRGHIVAPRGDKGFGWSPIFMPEGQTQTFAELDPQIQHALSMRTLAARKLALHLDSGN